MTLSAAEVNELKQAPPIEGVMPIILKRWSPRSFSDRDVSASDLETIFEAVRWSASSYNEQPWRYLVGKKGSETYQKIFSSLVEFNQKWAQTAPVLILNAASTKFSHNGQPNSFAFYDLGASGAILCLQAASLGLHTHQMAGLDKEAARKSFGIPEDFLIGSVTALGYQGEPDALGDPQMVKQETSPRARKTLQEFVLSGWGEPAKLT